jgi:solute carrier family 38 (sodium-coupled neutral amino acid transporter), member 11
MLGRRGHQNGHVNGDSQPLLDGSREDISILPTDNVVFAIEDDDEQETSALEETRPGGKVHFQDEVQIIAPRLRSTLESREAGMSQASAPVHH